MLFIYIIHRNIQQTIEGRSGIDRLISLVLVRQIVWCADRGPSRLSRFLLGCFHLQHFKEGHMAEHDTDIEWVAVGIHSDFVGCHT